jgi:hypothetical protein
MYIYIYIYISESSNSVDQAAATAICDATTGQLERISRFEANVFRITNAGDYEEEVGI